MLPADWAGDAITPVGPGSRRGAVHDAAETGIHIVVAMAEARRSWPSAGAVSMEAVGIWEGRMRTRMSDEPGRKIPPGDPV